MSPVYYYIKEYIEKNNSPPPVLETSRRFLCSQETVRTYIRGSYTQLGERESKVLIYIETYIRTKHKTPSLLDIAKHNSIAVTTAEMVINNLIEKHKITYHNKQMKVTSV